MIVVRLKNGDCHFCKYIDVTNDYLYLDGYLCIMIWDVAEISMGGEE